MAVGDIDDFEARLRGRLPPWFGDVGESPILDALLYGLAATQSWLYGFVAYVRDQARIATASSESLNIICRDFFGGRVARRDGESDATFRSRIKRELLRPKATRAALISTLTELTGSTPIVFEPSNTSDTGGWDLGGIGYDAGGGWGDTSLPFQAFVTVFRPPIATSAVAGIDGWDGSLGGYDAGAIEYIGDDKVLMVSDADIDAAILSVIPVATIVWRRIENKRHLGARLNIDFVLNASSLS